jgi:hypothetical protein
VTGRRWPTDHLRHMLEQPDLGGRQILIDPHGLIGDPAAIAEVIRQIELVIDVTTLVLVGTPIEDRLASLRSRILRKQIAFPPCQVPYDCVVFL